MIDSVVWREPGYESARLSGAVRGVAVPKRVEYLSVQFGDLPVAERRATVRQVVDILCQGQPTGAELWVTTARHSGRAACERFIDAVGSETWWLGDILLQVDTAECRAVAWPDVDGGAMDIATWGARAAALMDEVAEQLAVSGFEGA